MSPFKYWFVIKSKFIALTLEWSLQSSYASQISLQSVFNTVYSCHMLCSNIYSQFSFALTSLKSVFLCFNQSLRSVFVCYITISYAFCLHKLTLFRLILQAYIHSRMRAKTSDFLKVLNRARPEVKDKEKKTIRSAIFRLFISIYIFWMKSL